MKDQLQPDRSDTQDTQGGTNSSLGHPHVVASAVYKMGEVCAILRISRSQGYRLRTEGRWPIPELTPSLGDVRFLGADILRYFNGDFASVKRHARSVAR